MEWHFGEVLVNKVSGEKYIIKDISDTQCLTLKSKDGDNEVKISASLLTDLFRTTWTKWSYEQFTVLNINFSVRWKHNKEISIMECPEYGLKVYAKLHPEDTFDSYVGYILCKIRMVKKILDNMEEIFTA